MFIKVFASGTNVQRLAKGSGRADGVIYSAYSQLEQTESDMSLGLYPAPPNLSITAESHKGHEHGDETQKNRKVTIKCRGRCQRNG